MSGTIVPRETIPVFLGKNGVIVRPEAILGFGDRYPIVALRKHQAGMGLIVWVEMNQIGGMVV
jgi:hypothetical protein